MVDKTIKSKCPIGFEELSIEILDLDERILTRKRGPDGKYRHIPRKETKYPKYEVSCPSLETPHLADLPPTLRDNLLEEGKWWCKKREAICTHEQFIPPLLTRA